MVALENTDEYTVNHKTEHIQSTYKHKYSFKGN